MLFGGGNDYKFDFVVLIVFIAVFLIKRMLNNRTYEAPANFVDGSLILTMYSLGVGMTSLSKGTLNDMPYNILITEDLLHKDPLPGGMIRAPAGQVIMSMDLPEKSEVHIAGFSAADSHLDELLGNTNLDNSLVKVNLEGDFQDYFRLYCSPGREVELREILDPSSMEFLVDFCKKLNWELFENTLYFVQSQTTKADEYEETMTQAAGDFAKKILPTLQRMSNISPQDSV